MPESSANRHGVYKTTHHFPYRFRYFLREHTFLLIILILAIAVRSWKFGTIPPGLNQDEASAAYDAFSLLHYGIDRNGFPFPVVLISWGSGMNSLATMLTIPFLAIFGESELTARLPMFFLGILTIIAFYAVCRRIDPKFGILGALVLAISPWHIMLTRWGLESNAFPGILLLGVWALLSAIDKRRTPLLAAALFGICLYAYGTAYLVVPIFLVITYSFLLYKKKLTLKSAVRSMAVFLIVALPLVAFIIINHFQLPSLNFGFFSIPRFPATPRYSSFPTLFQDNALPRIWDNARTLWHILVFQDDNTFYNVLPGYGYAYIWSLPLIVIGFLVCCRRVISSRSMIEMMFLVWFAASLILAFAISVNVNRINCIFLPLLFFLAVGIDVFRRNRLIFAGIITAFLLSFYFFSRTYFTTFPKQIGPRFFASFGEAINYASENTSGPICVTGNVNMPYIFVLYYRQMNPHVFLNTVQYTNPHGEFRGVGSFDRYTFGLDECSGKVFESYILTLDEANGLNPSQFTSRRFANYAVARPIRIQP